MTPKKYAEKSFGRDVFVMDSYFLPPGTKVMVNGYHELSDAVIVRTYYKRMGYDANDLGVNATWLIHPGAYKDYVLMTTNQLGTPFVGNEVLIGTTLLVPHMRKPISNYPHKCYHCGAASYNAMYGGKIDCSAKCKATTSA